MSDLSNGDSLIRALYQGCIKVPVGEFAVWALGLVSADLNCSGVRWEIRDAFGVCAVRRTVGIEPPSTSIATDREKPARKDIFETGIPGLIAGLKHCISYFRQPREFSEAERALLLRFSEYLPHAEHLNQEFAMRLSEQNTGFRAEDKIGTAMVSIAGYVHWANASFRELLRAAHRNWGGISLPFTLDWSTDGSNAGFVYQDLYVWGKRVGEHFELHLRKDRRLQKLSPREYEISTRVAKGLTFKEISGELNIAPSTVSTHLYNLYDKLGIRRRAELIEWLNGHDGHELPAGNPETSSRAMWSV